MTKSLTRFVSTVTIISALGLGAAFAQTPAPATGNAASTPAVTAPATGKVDAKAGHKTAKDQAGTKTHALKSDANKTDATKTDAVKTDKKAAVDAPQTLGKVDGKSDGKATTTVVPKS